MIWTHRNGIYLNKFFVVSCWIACSAKMNECLTILFYLFFLFKTFYVVRCKITKCLKKLNSRGKTTWAILFRNFSHKISNPPEHILYAFSAKNTYHTILEMALKRTTTTHAIQIKIKAMNEKWPVRHEFSKAQDHIESSSSCFYATYQNTLPLNLCLHCNCWNDGPDYTKSYPYTYIVAQWIHLTHKKMQCSRNLGAVRCRCCC